MLNHLGWLQYPNYCVSSSNIDLPETPNSAGSVNVETCKSECNKNFKCTAIEWYEGGCCGTKCKLMLGDIPSTKGYSGPRWEDAVCYVKPKLGKVKHL